MAEGTIVIGSTTLDTPVGYIAKENFLKNYERTPYGTLIINRNVYSTPFTNKGHPISKYRFEISDIVNSKMYAIKEEAAHIGNLYYIDYLQIVEVLSGDGSNTIVYAQRQMSGTTPVPVITLGGVSKTVTVTEDEDPPAGEVYVHPLVILNGKYRSKFFFGDTPPNEDDNIVIRYEPKFLVHIVDYQYIGRIMNVGHYSLICEEI